jgi:hypothetical protein
MLLAMLDKKIIHKHDQLIEKQQPTLNIGILSTLSSYQTKTTFGTVNVTRTHSTSIEQKYLAEYSLR